MASHPWKSQRFVGGRERLRPAVLDPLDEIGLLSKGDERLLDFKIQENYFDKIYERCLKLNGNPKPKNDTIKLGTALSDLQLQQKNIGSKDTGRDVVLLAMRKLREGLVATTRSDDFAFNAYKFIIRTAVEWTQFEAYQPALLHLLHRLHPRRPLSEIEVSEFASYRVLDLACRLAEYGQAYVVRLQWDLRDALVDQVLGALVKDNWCEFWKCRSVAGHRHACLIATAEARVRSAAAQHLTKAYFTVDRSFVRACMGQDAEESVLSQKVTWKVDGEKVTVRQMKGR